MTAHEAARTQYDDASRVLSVFTSLVNKRREAWRTAAPKDAAKRRVSLAEAVKQQDAARATQNEAWKTWHALSKGGPEDA